MCGFCVNDARVTMYLQFAILLFGSWPLLWEGLSPWGNAPLQKASLGCNRLYEHKDCLEKGT